MALEATFRELSERLKVLQDLLFALHLTVSEDKPMQGDAALVDHFDDTIRDMRSLIEQCIEHSNLAQMAVDSPLDLDRTRRELTKCQQEFQEAEGKFSDKLASYEKLRALAGLGGRRGGEWPSWANSVRHGTEQCREPFCLASKALALCWQEIAEHAGAMSVSVKTTNVGQKIVSFPSATN